MDLMLKIITFLIVPSQIGLLSVSPDPVYHRVLDIPNRSLKQNVLPD